MTTSDQIFAYFQNHWSDEGGNAAFGFNWWFDGVNDHQGWGGGWSQVESSGGGFFTGLNHGNYVQYSANTGQAMSNISTALRAGRGVALSIYGGVNGHAITCWGYAHDPSNPNLFRGLYVTDSDDNQNNPGQNNLQYYQVAQSNGRWYLQDFAGNNNWYITAVCSLARRYSSGRGAAAAGDAQARVASAFANARCAEAAKGLEVIGVLPTKAAPLAALATSSETVTLQQAMTQATARAAAVDSLLEDGSKLETGFVPAKTKAMTESVEMLANRLPSVVSQPIHAVLDASLRSLNG